MLSPSQGNPLRAILAPLLLALAFASAPLAAPLAQGGGLARHLARAQELESAGDLGGARAEYERVLERDPRHLIARYRLARIAREAGDLDLALDHAARFLEVWRHLDPAPRELRGARDELAALVREVDPFAREARELRRRYVGRLLEFAERQMDQGRWHSARAILLEALGTDPDHPDLRAGLERIRREGGNELAVEDETGGVDPLAGVTEEWVEENDPLHEDWEKAWTFETDHYRIRTNAGYRVLMTVANAMEQMNVFYRRFHRFHEDGKGIPVAGVHIFKTYEEYKTIGGAPTDWAGGHWDGSKVVTFDHRQGRDGSLRDTLQTLFHEASHQFTSLAGGSAVPAWLNEGMASFFEGTKLLSNGRIEWNLVAPGRLYPLAADLDSDSPHTLEQVITGRVEDYRVYYPWGWGIVYYLYNAEDEDGRLLYRDRIAEYFQQYHTPNHLERFDQYFVSGGGVEGIETLADFEQRFVAYIRRLVAEDRGEIDTRGEDEARGDRQVALGDWEQAVRIYERLLAKDPGNLDVLWKLAGALEEAGQHDRAAGTLREWLAASLASGRVDPKRKREAKRRIAKLDKLAQGLEGLRTRYHLDSVALAERYAEAGFPRRALRLLRGPATALPPSEEARRRYFEIADASGVQLEEWRLLFDEESLAGFYGGGQENFRVQDGVIVAEVDADPNANAGDPRRPRTGVTGEGGDVFSFRRLFIDHEPAGDWSLSAEVALSQGCRMAGLCFGKKGDGLFHGVVLLPEGYADLSAFETDGRTLNRVKVDLAPGWNRLRMDVAGTRLVVWLGDEIVFEHEFETRAPLQGDFGLLAGAGRSSFREIRLLEYDPSLPRRDEIGSRRRRAPVGGDLAEGYPPPERAEPGRPSYLGQAPPALAGLEWVASPPAGGDLDRLLGWPVLLVFWTTYQERALPLLPGLERLRETLERHEIPVLLVSDEPRETVEGYLAEHPLPWPIGLDTTHAVYGAYALGKLGLPRALLIDVDGTVVWEGNPDYDEAFGTYLDEPLAKLIQDRKLAELIEARERLARASEAFDAGRTLEALGLWREVVALGVEHPIVARARRGLAALESRGEALLEEAEERLTEGRVLEALALLEGVVGAYPGLGVATKAAERLEQLGKEPSVRATKRLANLLARAEALLARGRAQKAAESLEELLGRLGPDDDPRILERGRFLREGLAAGRDPQTLLAAYRVTFPEAASGP